MRVMSVDSWGLDRIDDRELASMDGEYSPHCEYSYTDTTGNLPILKSIMEIMEHTVGICS